MQQLDQYQVADFNHHWSQTFAKVDGKAAYIVEGRSDIRKAYVSFWDNTAKSLGKNTTVEMDAIEIWRPPSGFYNVDVFGNQELLWLRKFPRQSMRRGIDNRNVALYTCNISDTTLMTQDRRAFENCNLSHIESPDYYNHNATKLKAEVADITSDFRGVALTRKVAIIRGDDLVPYVVCESTVVGYVSPQGVIKVIQGASCFLDMLRKQDVYEVEVQ